MYRHALFVALVLLTVRLSNTSQQSAPQQDKCSAFTSCFKCLAEPGCLWCSRGPSDSMCAPKETIDSKCSDGQVERPFANYTITKSEALSQTRLVQPQEVTMALTLGRSAQLNVSLHYSANYPADVYYLMDLSHSMTDDKDTLSTIAEQLGATLKNLTTAFKIGLGTFVDKPVPPFTFANNNGVPPPHSFNNSLPLTDDIKQFKKMVDSTKISYNADAPEGSLEAAMQAVVCEKQIGWRSNSRRVLVIATDASFHTAGDGKLAGIIKPNDGLCHLDETGLYTHSTVQDYPSVSHLAYEIQKHSVNLIMAVSSPDDYNLLSKRIPGSRVAGLSQNSSNIVTLIEEQYMAITSTIKLSANNSNYLSVTFYSKCAGDTMKKTDTCTGVKISVKVDFDIEIKLLICPPAGEPHREVVAIGVTGLSDNILITVDMHCDCSCSKNKQLSEQCSNKGYLRCGRCVCEESSVGRTCECSNDAISDGNETGCRLDNSSSVCGGQGTCVCNKCQCNENYSGDYCDCSSITCPYYQKQLCGGHGTCECNQCRCHDGWTGADCSCSTDTSQCHPPDSAEQCSGNGNCKCNKCQCHETNGTERYFGKYCDTCPNCEKGCSDVENCVRCIGFDLGPISKDECLSKCSNFNITLHDKVEAASEKERTCFFVDDQNCRYRFIFANTDGKSEGPIGVRVLEEKTCPPPINVLNIVLTLVASIVVVGLALLLLWKLLTTIHDRREYAKWKAECQSTKFEANENPLYKQATSTFKNPVYGQ